MAEQLSRRSFDIITIADLGVDLILSGADISPQFGQIEKLVDAYCLELGGSCGIFACQAAKMDLRTSVLGRVGDDQFGKLILARLDESGARRDHVQTCAGLKTGLTVHLNRGDDRAMLTYLGSFGAIEPDDVSDPFLGCASHLHYGSYFLHVRLRSNAPDIFRRARALGLTISLDSNWDPEQRWHGLDQVLPYVDVFLPNEQEARHIANVLGASVSTLAQTIQFLLARMNSGSSARAPVVVCKRGEQGALACCEGKIIEWQVTPALSGGDSIGAGDSFDAGFLAGWLRGRPISDCLRIGSACGHAVAESIGGIQGQPCWNEVNAE